MFLFYYTNLGLVTPMSYSSYIVSKDNKTYVFNIRATRAGGPEERFFRYKIVCHYYREKKSLKINILDSHTKTILITANWHITVKTKHS